MPVFPLVLAERVARPLLVACLLLGAACSTESNLTAPPKPVRRIFSITVTPSTPTITAGESVAMTAVAKDSVGGVIDTIFNWSSDNTGVATVDNIGLVSGLSAGTSKINATIDTITGSANVTVTAPLATPPELPRVFLNTDSIASSGATINVASGDNLQTAIDNANLGDIIVLAAGATFNGPITLPNKSGSGWLTIRSSGTLPAQHTRARPSNSGAMAKIVSTFPSDRALRTAVGAHNIRIVGVEITVTSTLTSIGTIMELGDGNPTQNDSTTQVHDIIIDRSYVHGTAQLAMQRCISLQGRALAVIDSWVSDCHGPENSNDTQAIASWNGTGPFKIVNNYLEASGENMIFGGADPAIVGLTPSDIEIRRNHIIKPPSYKGVYEVKNLFEVKNAARVLIEANIFDGSWQDAQVGEAIKLKSENQSGNARWSVCKDITIRYNIIRNEAGPITTLGHLPPNPVDSLLRRVSFINNLFYNINVGIYNASSPPYIFQGNDNESDVVLSHNTFVSTGPLNGAMTFGSIPSINGFVVTNNIFMHGQYGIKGPGQSDGLNTLNTYTPGFIFLNNMMIGSASSAYPETTIFTADLNSASFTNVGNDDYSLTAGSPGHNAATDGTDIGADVATINTMTAGVVVAP